MSSNDGAAAAISMSVGEELSRLMVQADYLREENERLRKIILAAVSYLERMNDVQAAEMIRGEIGERK